MLQIDVGIVSMKLRQLFLMQLTIHINNKTDFIRVEQRNNVSESQ